MFITLRNNENLIIESTRHKINLKVDYSGQISLDYADRDIKISDELMINQIEQLIERNNNWGLDRLQPTKEFIIDLVNKGSKALNVDKNKLCSLMIEKCSYSMINYFQPSHFFDFKSSEEKSQIILDLKKQIFELDKKHKQEIIALQKELTKAKKIQVEKLEVNANGFMDFSLNVNCPFCDTWQEIKDISDYYPNDGEFECNQICEKCEKVFSVKFDGVF
jgi:hypothetical protein